MELRAFDKLAAENATKSRELVSPSTIRTSLMIKQVSGRDGELD